MTFDQAQSSRLGQRAPIESTYVRMFSGTDIPEAAWPGQIIYRNETQGLQIFNGDAWEDVVGGVPGALTFVGDTIPVAQHEGDIWFDSGNDNRMYVAHSDDADAIGTGEWEAVSAGVPPITETTYIYHQDTPPGSGDTPPPKDNDFWYETPGNHQYYYLASAPGTHWVSVRDTGIQNAQSTADAAQSAAGAAQADADAANAAVAAVVTDGHPPVASPDAEVIGGIGALFVQWDAISNPDAVTYEVHLSVTDGFAPDATTLAAETAATQITLRTLPDSTPLAYGTVYFVRIVAKDADPGVAPPGAQGSGEMMQVTTPDVAANYVYAGFLAASRILGGTITSTISISGVFQTAAPPGRRAVMDSTGIHLYESGGAPLVDLPTDPTASASFTGSASISNLSVGTGLSVQTKGTIESGAGLELVGGVTAPAAAPGVVLDHPMGASPLLLPNTNGTVAGQTNVCSCFDLAANSTSLYTVTWSPSFLLTRHPLAGGAATTTRTLATTIYPLAVACDGDTAIWYLYQNSNTLAFYIKKADPTTLADVTGVWPVTAMHYDAHAPVGMSIIGGVAYVGATKIDPDGHGPILFQVNLATGAATTYIGADTIWSAGTGPGSDASYAASAMGFASGVFDFGDSIVRHVFNINNKARVLTTSGATLVERTTDTFPFGVDGGVGTNGDPFAWIPADNSGTGGFRQTRQQTTQAMTIPPPGTTNTVPWKSTTPINWTTESATWYASTTWRDSNSAGPAGTSETTEGKRATFTMLRRHRVRLSVTANFPGSGGTDDPNSISFYMGRSPVSTRTDMHLQGGTLADGVKTLDLTAVSFVTAAPPDPANATLQFPGSIPGYLQSGSKRQDGAPKVYIDGLGVSNNDGLIPPGSMMMYGGTTAPAGWLICDGTAKPRALYPDLATALWNGAHYAFGDGDGISTFNLPDMQDRVPMGASATKINGTKGGTNQIAPGQLPQHQHTIAHDHGDALILTRWSANTTTGGTAPRIIDIQGMTGGGGTGVNLVVNVPAYSAASAPSGQGPGLAGAIDPKYTTVNYIIKT